MLMRSSDFGQLVSPLGAGFARQPQPRGGLLALKDGGAARYDVERFRRSHRVGERPDRTKEFMRELVINGLGTLGGAGIGAGAGRLALRFGSPYLADVARLLQLGQAPELAGFGPLGLKRTAKALPSALIAQEPAYSLAEDIAP